MSRDQRIGALLVITAALGFSFLPIITKSLYAVSELEAIDIATWRFIFATPLIWLLIMWRKKPVASSKRLPRNTLLGMGIIFAISAYAAFVGLEYINASTYVVLFYTYPAMVALLSLMLGQRLLPVAWVALALTMAGVMLTVPDFAEMGADEWPGIIAALVNAFSVAVYFLLSGKVMHGHTAIARSTAWVITGTLLTFLVIIPVNGLNLPQNSASWANLVALSAVCTVMPIFLLNTGIQKIGAARASIISTIEPVVSMLLAVLLVGEIVLPVQWLGAMLIVASVILLQLNPRRKQKQTTASPA